MAETTATVAVEQPKIKLYWYGEAGIPAAETC
jgi:hypothetical protein